VNKLYSCENILTKEKQMKSKLLMFAAILSLLAFSLSAQESTSEGWAKSFGQTTHPGSPYDVIVTQSVSAGWDFDQDGNKEFIVCADHSNPNGGGPEYPTGASIWLYEASPTGYELAWSWFDTTLYTGGASFPVHAGADLDGDGNEEILLGVPYGTGNPPDASDPYRFYVWEGGSNGLPAWNGTVPPEADATWNFNASVGSNTRPAGIAVDDIDGDGVQEVAIAFRAFSDAVANDGMMIFSLGASGFDGDFTDWTIEALDTTMDVGSVYAVAISDIDNDGKKEAYFSTDWGVFFEASAADTYTSTTEFQFMDNAGNAKQWALQAAGSFDMDGDGDEELLVGRYTGPIRIFNDVADLATADSSDVYTIANVASGIRGMAVGDFDGNGLGEIYVGGNYSSAVYEIKFLGGDVTDAANYTEPAMIYQADTSGSVRTYSVAFGGADLNGGTSADLNGDGDGDIVIAHEDGDTTATEYVVVITRDHTVAIDLDLGKTQLTSYKLQQNFPNPFNPTTNIDYVVGEAGELQLTIYDITGREIKTLYSSFQTAGDHSISWDGTDASGKLVSSGIYIYKMDINGASMSRHMTLLR